MHTGTIEPGESYCEDVDCWCHTDVEYHEEVTDPMTQQTEEDVEHARSFFGFSLW